MSEAERPERPNVLLIDCNDLGDWLGCCGRPYVNTPRIDGLAADGLRFSRFYATAPICGPSRAGLYSGCYAHRLGIYGNPEYPLPRRPGFLARILRDGGYRTGLCGAWKTHGTPEDAGYQVHTAYRAEDRESVDLIAELAGERPFLAHFSFQLVHRPLGGDYDPDAAARLEVPADLPDTPTVRADLASLCRNAEQLDGHVGRILEALEEAGLTGETLVVFAVDHGAPLPRAKHTCYDAGMLTPLIMGGSGVQGAARVDATLLSNIDLVPTLAEVCEVEVPRGIDGVSFAPLLAGRAHVGRGEVFSEFTYGQRSGMQYYTPIRTVRTDRFRLIRNFETDPVYLDGGFVGRFTPEERPVLEEWPLFGSPSQPWELYDLEQDPWQRENLAVDESHQAVLRDLQRRLEVFLTETGDEIVRGRVASRKTSPVVQQWIVTEQSPAWRLRQDTYLDTKERPFP